MIDRSDPAAVIFGAASDVGLACARRFAADGYTLFLMDEDEAALAGISRSLLGFGGAPTILPVRLGDWDSICAAAAVVAASIDKLDVLVTAPMRMDIVSIEDSTPGSWTDIVGANLLGPLFAAKALLDLLKKADGASIVHVGSIDGILGNPMIPSYSAAKGGINALTHVMASEFAMFDIRVNCVARAVAVDGDVPLPEIMAPLIEPTPLGRPADLREIAAVVRFLASSESSYVNGVVLPVDGGRSVLTPGTRRPPHSTYRSPMPRGN